MKNGKEVQVEVLVDSRYTHTEIDKQLVKDRTIQMKLVDFSFEVFNVDRTKNRKVTKMVLLEIESNKHKKQIDTAVTDINGTDMFLEHDWLVKHNLEVNWKEDKIQFMRCLKLCRIKYQDIRFIAWKIQTTEIQEKDQQEIGKELDLTNPEDLPEYIQPFTYLFNKKKFEKLPE